MMRLLDDGGMQQMQSKKLGNSYTTRDMQTDDKIAAVLHQRRALNAGL